MKKRIFNLVILDESGSMSCIENEAITGVNETIQTIRAAQQSYSNQEYYVSLVSFNSHATKTIYNCLKADEVKELTSKEYVPSCGTPLYDAMGDSLTKLKKKVAEEDNVLVTIITDGYENDSHEYNAGAIKALVESLKAKGWVFTYIGANQNAQEVAFNISINNSMNFQSSHEGTHVMFEKESQSRRNWYARVAEGREDLSDNYFDDEDDKKSK